MVVPVGEAIGLVMVDEDRFVDGDQVYFTASQFPKRILALCVLVVGDAKVQPTEKSAL